MGFIAGITSNTVPWEILRAAGYAPRLMEAEPGPTPFSDRFMEDVFDRRARVIFDRLCSGAWKHLDMVVIPRTSEQEHKLFLYLHEMSRKGYSENIPQLYFYNLLHTRSHESRDYGLERTRQMVRDLAATETGLKRAIAESNEARVAVRDVLQRRREGTLEGSDAIAMIRGFYMQDRELFAKGVRERLNHIRAANSDSGPRIMIKGAPLDHAALHRLIEQHGGYVVAEDDWHGSRAAGDDDIRTNGDPVVAIFEKYFEDAVSPRVFPSERADAWFHREVEGSQVDGVLFYIPLEDDVLGWDYPRQLELLQSRGLPSMLVRESAIPEPTSRLIDDIARFIEDLRRA